ncbi:MAG: hypothetical protein GY809_04500 [Planctomycetes bacterium]|nr:hypothetical protein [Planctomycetota bacterium]
MKSFHRGFRLVSVVLVLTFCTGVWGAAQNGGLIGQWHMTLDFETGRMPSVLSFTKGAEGVLKAEWVHIMGISQVTDVKREGKDLTFTVETRIGDQDNTGSFVGSLARGELSGLITSDQGDINAQGKKVKRMPLIVGTWDMTITVGEREVNTVLKVTQDEQGTLQGEWQSQWGEHKISDVQFKAGKLTFNRVSTFNDNEWKTAYEGTMKNHALTGAFKSDRGDITANGKRAHGVFVGKWNLTMTSDRGTQTQRLTILPNLTARFGATPIKTLKFDGPQVSFDMTLPFGDDDYKLSFEGTLEARNLSGKMTSAQGTSDVAGTKVMPVRRKK